MTSIRRLRISSIKMPSPLFDFFEMIAEELTLEESRVLTATDFDPEGNNASVLDELRVELNVLTNDDAIQEAVKLLGKHFEDRGSRLPFSYEPQSNRFKALDKDYLRFVTEIKQIRGQGKNAKTFEITAMNRIKLRVTGSLHRVGHPRDLHKKRAQFNAYLAQIGFNGNVLLGHEKDGGFDILWVLPIGPVAFRPVISLQCKNSGYKLADGDTSYMSGKRSLNQHKRLMAEVHFVCVIFNDYITDRLLPKKAMQWVPLGLSDLGQLQEPVTAIAI